jgi:hypothetical protein
MKFTQNNYGALLIRQGVNGGIHRSANLFGKSECFWGRELTER